MILSATAAIRSGLPTEVPPYFCTISAMFVHHLPAAAPTGIPLKRLRIKRQNAAV
jgi:hypothetical protein